MSGVNHTVEDPSRQVWTTTADEPKSYALSGKIMLTAIIILFAVVVFLVILHLYARWYLLRVRRRYLNRRRSRQQRATHLIFYVDPNNPTMLTVPSRGLNPDVLNSLPAFVYSKKAQVNEQPPLECAVCLSEFEENEQGKNLPKCNHSFHTDCIDMWFESHSTCPLCRSPVEPISPPVTISNDVVISIPRTSEPEPSSSSEFSPTCQYEGGEGGTTSLAGRRKGLEMAVEVPKGNTGSDVELRLSSPASSGFRSPGSRLLSLKRILSMKRKGAAVSPSSGAGPSCGSVHSVVTAESEVESGRFEFTQLQNRAQSPR